MRASVAGACARDKQKSAGVALSKGRSKRAPDVATANGTVLVFHGNAGCAKDREPYCGLLNKLGWRAVIAEYPGYGARKGMRSEAVSACDEVRTMRRVSKKMRRGGWVSWLRRRTMRSAAWMPMLRQGC